MIAAAASARAQTSEFRRAPEVLGEKFSDFLSRARSQHDTDKKAKLVNELISKVRTYGGPLVSDSTVFFVYQGNAKRVGVPSDLNAWNPQVDTMFRLDGTNFFFLEKNVDQAARFEYKLVVDSSWSLDPLNRQTSAGGYGFNSEVRMEKYRSPKEIEFNRDIPHGTIDTIAFKSAILGRTHPVFVYLPPTYKRSRDRFPTIWVTDGGEYLTLALMNNVLDNLIAEERIRPVVAVFIDPRTDVRDSGTSTRMYDYTMSDTFVTALTLELRPRLLKKYRISEAPGQTAIMGASLGGLIATYVAYKHPDIFGLVAAQSPSYWWSEGRVIKLLKEGPMRSLKFYIDTGTIRDAEIEARKMKSILEEKGYPLVYSEYPEGHNWANWRARIDDILMYFWGVK